MSTFHGYDQPQSILVSDNVMPGDDNTVPQPGHNDPIFNAWWNLGGAEGIPPTEPPVGVPFDTNHSGPGVHIWGGGLVQDVTAPGDDGILMLFYGQSVAYWVHGSIRNFYFAQGGATGSLGYPVSNEYPWQGYTRSDFQGESICASITQGTNYCDVIGILDVSPTPTPTHTQVPTPTNTGVPTATSTPLPQQSQTLRPTGAGTYTEWGEMFGSGTTHWDRVDDVAPDDTGSYIMDNTWSGTERDSYQLSDTSLSSISSVEVVARAARITTNDNNDVKLFIHSGSVDAESVAKPLSMSWGEVSNVWTTDPATSGPWTQSAVNALQAGVRDAMGGGGGGGVGVTQVYVIVTQGSQTLRPTANGNYTEWGEQFGSGTTHWDRVDEATVDDAGSYIMDNTWNGTERDAYQMSDTSYSSITSIEVFARAARVGTNDNNNVKLSIRSGSVDQDSTAKTLSMSWGYVSNVWTTDPATGLPWTTAAVNALQAGVRNAMGPSGGGGVGVSQVYVVVHGS
ncbi:MAG TPA: hypothetical protein VIC55_11230 [Gemmatimonadaceae bacterium]|jgi:hypothetical protein